MARNRRRENCVYSKWLNREQQDLALRRILKLAHQGVTTNLGPSLIIDSCFCLFEVWRGRLAGPEVIDFEAVQDNREHQTPPPSRAAP